MNGCVHRQGWNAIFDAIGAPVKEWLWIAENQRFFAYNYFGQHPERLVGWFDRHMGGGGHPSGRSTHRLRRDGNVQFSIVKPCTRSNSALLFVTSVSP